MADDEAYESLPINDFSKLRIIDGSIHYRLYRQDGTMQDMVCKDTLDNRLFVSWVQQTDRYTISGENQDGKEKETPT